MADNKLISKVTLGGVIYDLKDSDARGRLDSLESLVAEGVQILVVESLPLASKDTVGKFYFVANEHDTQDIYDEYITVLSNSTYSWEKIGSTNIDLSNYWSKTELTNATASTDGLMSSVDKIKLDGIEVGTSVDSALSLTSENPVQNKVVSTALNNKVNSSDIINKTKSELESSWAASEIPDVQELDLTSFVPYSGATDKIDLNGQTLTNIAEPINDADITTKNYVDSSITTATSKYLKLEGGTMGGTITMNNFGIFDLPDPVEDKQAANKQYVDNLISGNQWTTVHTW